jgi:RNA recognition motif. (a.k.a. RRM, RBD, or RNP domain)
VWLGNIDDSTTEQSLFNELSQFGPVDTIRILHDKRIAFVHLCSIAAAIQAVNYISVSPQWESVRVYYGKDRCTQPLINTVDPFGYGSAAQPFVSIGQLYSPGSGFQSPLSPLSLDSQFSQQIPNRTIYIGGIHMDATAKDLCDVCAFDPGDPRWDLTEYQVHAVQEHCVRHVH